MSAEAQTDAATEPSVRVSRTPVGTTLSERWFDALYETPLLFSGILDDAGLVLDANELAIEGCGFDRDATVGLPFWECGWWNERSDPHLQARVRGWVEDAIGSGEHFRTTSRFYVASGERRIVDLSLRPFRDENGRSYVVAMGNDITDAAEAVALRQERELAAAEDARRLATARVTQLSAVALDVVRAETVEDLERVVIGRGLQVLGAQGGAVSVRDDMAGVVRLAISESLGDEARVEYAELPLSSRLPAAHVARTGEEVLLPTRESGLAWSPLNEDVYRLTDRAAWATLPLQVGERLLGALVVGWREERDFGPEELALLRGFAAMCAQALDRIQHLQADRAAAHASQELSETLQRSLLTQPPTPDALDIAVRYQPAQEAAQVGGDWYDAFVTASGSTMLVVGDVSGHDQIAAATMGQVRNVLRGLAFDSEDGPAHLLRRLDEALNGLELDTLATAVLARVEQPEDYRADGRRRLRWTNAGHLPPLLREPDGTVHRLERGPDLLLGLIRGAERAEHTVDLVPGSTLLLYTDGLVERRDEELDESIDALMDSFSRVGNRKPDEVCDAILEVMGAEAGDDDVAMLVLRCGD